MERGLARLHQAYKKLVKSTVTHPAVFGYMIGNEIYDGVTGNAQFWTNFGKLIDAANARGSARARNRSSRLRPTTTSRRQASWPAIEKGEQSGKLKNIDAWTINIYRGPCFGGTGGSSPFIAVRAANEFN